MNPVLAAVLRPNPEQGDYDDLPPAIQQYYTPREWSFMTDSQKADVVRSNTEPDWL